MRVMVTFLGPVPFSRTRPVLKSSRFLNTLYLLVSVGPSLLHTGFSRVVRSTSCFVACRLLVMVASLVAKHGL